MAAKTELDELRERLAAAEAKVHALEGTTGEQTVILPSGDIYRIKPVHVSADGESIVPAPLRPDTIDIRVDPKPASAPTKDALEAALAAAIAGK